MASKEAFFAEHYAYARQAGLSDVQARLAVSQAAVETGWGTKGIAVKGNNFFGMKVGDDWTGKSINLPTREETKKGKSYTVNANFRQYNSPVEAYRDWASQMEKNWPGVMKAQNFDQAVDALNHGVKGVYATDNDYGKSLKGVNRDLEKSGIPAKMDRAPADLGPMFSARPSASPFGPVPNAGIGGGLLGKYRGLVEPRSVETSRVPAALAPTGLMNETAQTKRDRARALQQEQDIASLHPAFQDRARNFLSEAKKRGLDISIVPGQGYRTAAEQDSLSSLVTGVKGGGSFHQYGLGFDVVPAGVMEAAKKPGATKEEKNWSPNDPRYGQIGALAKEMGLEWGGDFTGKNGPDPGHIHAPGWGLSVPQSLRNMPTFEQAGNTYPSLDETSLERVADRNGRLARSMAGTGLLGLDGRMADTSSIVAGAGLRQPDSAFAAPLGRVDRAPLADIPSIAAISPARTAFDVAAAGFAPTENMRSPAVDTRQNFPGMSIPTDVASPRTMAASLGGIGGFLADQEAASTPPDQPASGWSPQKAVLGLLGLGGPESPSPNRPMPDAPNVSTAFAPPSNFPARPGVIAPNIAPPDFAGLQAIQDKREYERPGLANLLSPEMMAPAFRTPTEVADYNIADVISPIPGAPASPTVSPTPDLGAFPAAPAAPSTWDKVKYAGRPMVRDAMLGMTLGGPLGALGGVGIGLLGRNLPSLGPGFDAAAPERFSTGFGLPGITSAMGGRKGATGFSLSNPGMSYTSLGAGMGGLRRSDKFGWTERVNDAGSVVGIQYDDPSKAGFFGSVSKAFGSKFSGKNAGEAERASGKFDGPGLW